MPAAPQSRLGGDLCPGMPWLPPEHFEPPQGMLERPEGCKHPRLCALERVCWEAKQRELAGHRRNERVLSHESGEVDMRPVPVSRKTEEEATGG